MSRPISPFPGLEKSDAGRGKDGEPPGRKTHLDRKLLIEVLTTVSHGPQLNLDGLKSW
jgi:hypothetical protein